MTIVIIGAGGHAQIVADILREAGRHGSAVIIVGYLDDDESLHGRVLAGHPVIGGVERIASEAHTAAIVAVGANAVRAGLFRRLAASNERLIVARHPSAIVSSDVQIGDGTMICAGVIVNTGSRIGCNVILNTGATVDHHSTVLDHAHVGPGVHMGGEVTVGEGALVGIGAVVLPRVSIGAWSTVGAGAVVTKDVPAGATVVGIPARPMAVPARST